jgi:hypothetical protein
VSFTRTAREYPTVAAQGAAVSTRFFISPPPTWMW